MNPHDLPPELPAERRLQLLTILEREHNQRYAHLPIPPTRIPFDPNPPPTGREWRRRTENHRSKR